MSAHHATWGGSTSQGLGCSPIKAVRELGSERRETVRSISGAGARVERSPPWYRRDREGRTAGVPVIVPTVNAGVARVQERITAKHLSGKPTSKMGVLSWS